MISDGQRVAEMVAAWEAADDEGRKAMSKERARLRNEMRQKAMIAAYYYGELVVIEDVPGVSVHDEAGVQRYAHLVMEYREYTRKLGSKTDVYW
jgi:hypothetical protein